MQKARATSPSPALGPPPPETAVGKPPGSQEPLEATKRCGGDDPRRMKCKKCGQFSTPDLSTLRQHQRTSHGHGAETSPASQCSSHIHGNHAGSSMDSSSASSQWCQCSSDTLDSDTGCVTAFSFVCYSPRSCLLFI